AEFEVLLTEGSNTLSVIYGTTGDNGLTAVSGIQRDLNVFTSFSCDTPVLTPGVRVNYIPTGCGSPTPTPTATATATHTPTATPTATATGTPSATPTCVPGGTPGPWSTASPYPIPDVRYGFAQTATHFYVFGGVSNGTRVNNVNRMDLATGMWQSRASMPFTSEAPTCALMASTGIVYCTEGDTGN